MVTNFLKQLKITSACIITAMVISAEGATSVSQYGITWTFSEDRPVGQFVNGDWWVVGPVTITAISTPDDYPGRSYGAMLNARPRTSQGILPWAHSGDLPYDAAKNLRAQLPFLVSAGNTICSVTASADPGNVTEWKKQKTLFKEFAVLTVVAQAPAPGSFRPPYSGTDKTIKYNVSQLNYAAFRNIKAPITANIPGKAWMEDATVRPLLEMSGSYRNSDYKAANDPLFPRRTYGREISNIAVAAGMFLNLENTNVTKERLLINICQWGIDIQGLISNGMIWHSDGGHQHGRKLPLFIAAKALGDEAMLKNCNASNYGNFQEDTGHWFVTQKDIDTPRVPSTIPPFTQEMLGMPEWSSGGPWNRERASPSWYLTGYRFINGGPNCGAVLCVTLMDGRAAYGHEAYFRYHIERYYPDQKSASSGVGSTYSDNIQLIVRDLWDSHILNVGSKISAPKGLKIQSSN